MGNKPKVAAALSGQIPGAIAAYFFLAGRLCGFCANSERVLTGMASIRRASSSTVISGASSLFGWLFFAFMESELV